MQRTFLPFIATVFGAGFITTTAVADDDTMANQQMTDSVTHAADAPGDEAIDDTADENSSLPDDIRESFEETKSDDDIGMSGAGTMMDEGNLENELEDVQEDGDVTLNLENEANDEDNSGIQVFQKDEDPAVSEDDGGS